MVRTKLGNDLRGLGRDPVDRFTRALASLDEAIRLDPENDAAWEQRGAVATRSEEHATHGRSSARVTFNAGGSPSFEMEHWFGQEPARGDWRAYGALRFDLFNPQSSVERLVLQLKDKGGHRYKQDLIVEGASAQHVSIRLNELGGLDPAQIVQSNLFRWEPQSSATFYLDAVRLTPALSRASTSLRPFRTSSATSIVLSTEALRMSDP
jgi:hypothetical protein